MSDGAIIFWGLIAILGVVAGVISYFSKLEGDRDDAKKRIAFLASEVADINNKYDAWQQKAKELAGVEEKLVEEKRNLDLFISQRVMGFPLIGEAYADYLDVKAKILSSYLRNKDHPSIKGADAVQKVTKEKRELIKQNKQYEYKIKYYEVIAPYLSEIEEEASPPEDLLVYEDYTEEEAEDRVTRFVTKDEYRKLSRPERNQLALDRYWTRGKKSKWAVGKMYEQYVGYLYEEMGWTVDYFGIEKRYSDLGRDLIATKGSDVHIIQCKNWSRFKRIYENHIFQLFGTYYEYAQDNPKKNVTPVFYTSTQLSQSAKEFAKRLEIKVEENHKLKEYPVIKCNINPRTKEKIYHLPFDQQYDSTVIEPRTGEFYALTIAEAEEKGFRRAFKWRGNKTS